MTFPRVSKLSAFSDDELLSGCTVNAYGNDGDERKERGKTAFI